MSCWLAPPHWKRRPLGSDISQGGIIKKDYMLTWPCFYSVTSLSGFQEPLWSAGHSLFPSFSSLDLSETSPCLFAACYFPLTTPASAFLSARSKFSRDTGSLLFTLSNHARLLDVAWTPSLHSPLHPLPGFSFSACFPSCGFCATNAPYPTAIWAVSRTNLLTQLKLWDNLYSEL